jgi:hypothetical protein
VLPLPGRPSEYARELPGSCFLFLTQEFQLAAVSFIYSDR